MATAKKSVPKPETKAELEVELEVGSPEWKRADYLRALKDEREQHAGNPERVKAIDAEIKRASKPVDRKAPEGDEA